MTRAERLSALALALPEEVDRLWATLPATPAFQWVAAPTCASVMARAQVNGDGLLFNLGEVVVTRCVIRLAPDGPVGVATVPGRSRRQAVRAALLEALSQGVDEASGRLRTDIAALRTAIQARQDARVASVQGSATVFGSGGA